MRVKTKWTPSGLLLWLLAAIVATLVVCTQRKPLDDTPSLPDEIEFEVESGAQ